MLWAVDGISVCGATGNQWYAQITSDGLGGAIIVWNDQRNSLNADIFAQRLNPSGESQWTSDGLPVCFMENILGYSYPEIISNGLGEFIVSWKDSRWGTYDIYAQKIDLAGIPSWGANGQPVCSISGEQTNAHAIPDGTGGAIVTWNDERSGYNDYDIYAAQMPDEGVPWPERPRNIIGTPIYHDNELVGLLIQWDRNVKPGIAHHNVHRDTNEDFIPSESNRLSSPVDTFTFDVNWNWMPHVFYKVNAVDSAGNESAYSLLVYADIYTESDEAYFPSIARLYQNHPNPFNPTTTIRYFLPENCSVVLEIFNVSGKRIACLINEAQEKGQYAIDWNGLDFNANPVSSGMYFYRLTAGKETISKKMVLLR